MNRQELLSYMNSGALRDAVMHGPSGLSMDASDLLVDIVARYCEPRRNRRPHRHEQAKRGAR